MTTQTNPGPTTINTTATQFDAFLKDLELVLTPAIEKILQGIDPPLALPIIEQIADEIESLVEDAITKQVELGATFVVIDAQTTGEDSKMDQAAQDLELAEASGDPMAISNAEDEYDLAQSGVAHDDGSAIPQ